MKTESNPTANHTQDAIRNLRAALLDLDYAVLYACSTEDVEKQRQAQQLVDDALGKLLW